MTTVQNRPPSAATNLAAYVDARPRLRRAIAPTLIGVLGLVISVAGAWVPSLWYDEVATVSSSLRSWTQLQAEIGTVDLVHAVYYALMHIWFDVVGYTPFTLRLPSALAIGGAAALVVVLGRQLGGTHAGGARLGLIAGVVFCLVPRITWAGTEGRSYALTALLAVGLTLVLVVASHSPRPRRWWILYALLAYVSILVFIYLALVLAAHAVTVVIWWLSERRRGREVGRIVRNWVVAVAAAALVAVPFVIGVAHQSGQLYWLPPIDGTTLMTVLVEQWYTGSPLFAVVAGISMVVGAALLVRAAWVERAAWVGRAAGVGRAASTGRAVNPRAAALVLPGIVIPTVLLLAATQLVTPLYTPRYLTMCVPFLALAIAAALTALRSRVLLAFALILLVAFSVPAAVSQRQPLSKESTAWDAVAARVAAERTPGPASHTAILYGSVAHHPRATARVIRYAYPQAFAGTVDPTLVVSAADSGRLWEYVRPLSDSLDRLTGVETVLLITTREARNDTNRVAGILAGDGWHITDQWIVTEVRIVEFRR